ncbi:type II toxin-antitoxin system HigB family toxin [Nitrincola nitratireducens]|uniref:type II toxin-antitoxin system HigB family toxin n=1 Tax=Nitrincola nitratireducens TaxID=1229521 RepID=UPI002351D43F|nr:MULTISPECIES: type II toxin-antitoxin system HigB family toxin [Nitrincola]
MQFKRNHFRLVVKVHYQKGNAMIEWVGTHAENRAEYGTELHTYQSNCLLNLVKALRPET